MTLLSLTVKVNEIVLVMILTLIRVPETIILAKLARSIVVIRGILVYTPFV